VVAVSIHPEPEVFAALGTTVKRSMRRPVRHGSALATTLADNSFEMRMAAGSKTQYRVRSYDGSTRQEENREQVRSYVLAFQHDDLEDTYPRG
jgi:hypothetical protein